MEQARRARLVVAQFNGSRPLAGTEEMEYELELEEGFLMRQQRMSGARVLEPTEDVGLGFFAMNLCDEYGYELVGMRARETHRVGMKPRFTIRFIFAPLEHVSISDEFRKIRGQYLEIFAKLCSAAMWAVEVYENPFYRDGAEVREEFTFSVNIRGRKSLFNDDRQPIMVWEKLAGGGRGEMKVPLQPMHHLAFSPNEIYVLPLGESVTLAL